MNKNNETNLFAEKNKRIQRKLNMDEQSQYSSGIDESHQSDILLKEHSFDLKGIQHFKRFVRMKQTYRRSIFF